MKGHYGDSLAAAEKMKIAFTTFQSTVKVTTIVLLSNLVFFLKYIKWFTSKIIFTKLGYINVLRYELNW